MRRSLYAKFWLTYALFALLGFFVISTLISQLTLAKRTELKADDLYREANYISSNFVRSYYSGRSSSSLEPIHTQFQALDVYLNASIWLLDNNGRILVNSKENLNLEEPDIIEEFDPADMKGSYYVIGDFYGYFPEKTLSVVAPVTYNFKNNGYVVLHTSYSLLERERDQMLNLTYIAMLIIFGLSLLILLVFTVSVYYPIKAITVAASQYAARNFQYEITVDSEDEIGRLADTMSYMALELAELDENQKKFVSNISHDFRSPLTSIKGYLEAMQDGTIPAQMQEKYIGIVLRETERLNKLTSGLLTLNSFDTKKNMLDITTFDINSVIKNTVSTFEGACTEKRIIVDLLFDSRMQPVSADMGKIQQVLYNLLDNAIKFSNSNSVITIETTARHEKIFISVKDTGIGIPKESQKRIWERFYKTDPSRGKDKRGTGLGLSIVKEIIQTHGEHINVISTEGVGTEFIFTLPRVELEEE